MAENKRYSRYFTYIQPVIRAPFVRTYGSLILTIVSLIVFIVFAIKPTIETILILQKQLSNQHQILDKLNQKSKNLSLGRKNYLDLDQNTKDKINGSVPASPAIGELTKNLENAAKSGDASLSAIQFQSFTINQPQKTKTLAEIPFTYNVEVSYSTALSVLSNLKKLDRLISIDQFSLNKLESGGRLLLSISGEAYYLK